MAEVGLLAPDARVELIEGEIIDMAPIGPAHAGTVSMLYELLYEAVGKRATIASQSPVRLGNDSEPEPDFAILRRRSDFYRKQTPTEADTLLVIEVSDTTWRYDRLKKLPFYARKQIPEVWIIDLPRETVHFFRALAGESYTQETASKTPGIVAIPGVPGASVNLSALFEYPQLSD